MTMKSNGFLIWMLLRHFKFVSITGVDTPGDTRASLHFAQASENVVHTGTCILQHKLLPYYCHTLDIAAPYASDTFKKFLNCALERRKYNTD